MAALPPFRVHQDSLQMFSLKPDAEFRPVFRAEMTPHKTAIDNCGVAQ